MLLSSSTLVQSQIAPKYSNEFLTLGVGGRAMAMSNAQVAASGDVYSGYWNTSSMVDMETDIEIAFMHSAYFAGIANYDYLAASAKVSDNSILGLSILRFGVDGIPNTFDLIRNGEINYDRVTSFSSVEYAFLMHYARNPNTRALNEYAAFRDARFSYGVNAKVINKSVGPFASALGFGFDASARLTDIKGGWSLGVMGYDITSTFNSWNMTFTDQQQDVLIREGNEIPINSLEITLPRFLVGVGKTWDLNRFQIFSALDLEMTTDGMRNTLIRTRTLSIDPRLGVEGAYRISNSNNQVFLRMGVGKFQQELNNQGKQRYTFMPTAGVGLRLGNFYIDYALTDIGDQSAALYSNIFSIKATLNGKSKS